MTEAEKLKNCYKCGFEILLAEGIGYFCPNEKCEVYDNVLGGTNFVFIESKSEYQKGYEDGKKAGLQWQPIETAPKDGTYILGCSKFAGMGLIIYWEENTPYWKESLKIEGFWHVFPDSDHGLELNPTHWMYLPQAPEVSGEKA